MGHKDLHQSPPLARRGRNPNEVGEGQNGICEKPRRRLRSGVQAFVRPENAKRNAKRVWSLVNAAIRDIIPRS
jgi:hypothetical protein